MKTLVELSSRALARMIEGKTPEEIRETFHLPDDLTEEEKLEPVKNVADDPRIRLLNRLYAKKRKVNLFFTFLSHVLTDMKIPAPIFALTHGSMLECLKPRLELYHQIASCIRS